MKVPYFVPLVVESPTIMNRFKLKLLPAAIQGRGI
jgi:hypothetical protein